MTNPIKSGDPYDLQRFVQAQAEAYQQALAEIRRGRKTTHWMWFVFPQLRGLGLSSTAWRYGIVSLAEARAYLAHDILGPRLRECAAAVASLERRTASEVFGSPDDQKLRSCLTLFEQADPSTPTFSRALDSLWAGERDPLTLRMLNDQSTIANP